MTYCVKSNTKLIGENHKQPNHAQFMDEDCAANKSRVQQQRVVTATS